jgi:hypothetical protein
MDAFHTCVSFLMCIQTIRSERKGQKHWREVWSATRPSSLSISHVHSADMDAFRARVISHVYSGNEIGNEGAEALARSLERNSSLTSLNLSCTLCRYGCVPRACHFSRVFRQSDRKGRGGSTGASIGAKFVPHPFVCRPQPRCRFCCMHAMWVILKALQKQELSFLRWKRR